MDRGAWQAMVHRVAKSQYSCLENSRYLEGEASSFSDSSGASVPGLFPITACSQGPLPHVHVALVLLPNVKASLACVLASSAAAHPCHAQTDGISSPRPNTPFQAQRITAVSWKKLL